MNVMLQYLTILVGFVALLMGVRGNTYDQRKKRITKLGYIAVAIGLISNMLSVVQVHSSQKKLDYESKQRDLVRRVALMDLRGAIHDLTSPFYTLCFEEVDKGAKRYVHWNATAFCRDAAYTERFMLSDEFLGACKAIRPEGEVGVNSGLRWCDYFSSSSRNALVRLNAIESKYSGYLTAQELAAIYELRNTEFVASLASFPESRKNAKRIFNAGDLESDSVADVWFGGTHNRFRGEEYEFRPFVNRLVAVVSLLPPEKESGTKKDAGENVRPASKAH
jgi:hypothetical protein